MTRIRKSVGRGRLVSTRLMTTLTMVVGLLVPASGAVFAAVDGVPGSTLDRFTQTELDTNWEADRYFPTDGVTSVSAFGRDDVARIGIDSTDTQPGTFQRTEGIKTVATGFFGRTVQVDLYLDPDWADKAVRAGVWVVGDNGSGARDNLFGIFEFLNMEPCPEPDCTNQSNIPDPAHEGFRVYDSTIGWSEYLATPFTYGEWVTLEITLDAAAGEYIYSIDGVEVATAAGGSHFISEVFLNSYNFGEDSFPTLLSDDYAAHWHVGSESDITWTTEVVYPGDMNDWAFGFDSGTDGSGEMVWGPGLPPAGGGSAFFELGDAATGYVLGTQGHDLAGMAFMDITALEYSTFRAAGGAAQAVALQFNVDYDLTDADTSWQGRLVYEPYYTQTVETGEWQTWDTLTTGANWWSTGTPKVGDAVATKHCLISDPCTWEEVLAYYPDAGIHELPLGAVILKAGSAWAGFEGNADELKIATGTTGTIFDFDPFAGLPCMVDWAGGGDFTTIADALAQPYCTEIKVAAGTYNEQVVIDKSLTLSGDPGDAAAGPGPNAPILDGNGVSGNAITIAGGVSGVVIEGFEIRNYAPGASGGIGVGVLAWSATPINDVTVRDNHFFNLGWSAVLVGNEGQALHSGWTVTRNTAEDVAVYVIELTNTTNSSVTRNVVVGGTAYGGTTDDAILIQAQVHGGPGVTVNSVTVEGNQISGTVERAGIELLAWDSTNSFTAALTGISILNNDVSNAERGVFLYPAGSNGSVDAAVTGNTLSSNATGVRASSWAGGTFGVVTINRNAITDNTAGFNNPTAQTLDATCNWWGDASGPDGTYGGTGDSIVGLADELPWLKSADLDGDCTGGFPVIEGLVDLVIADEEKDGEVVEFDPTATSVIDGDLPVTCLPASGSTFLVGETEVECEATDSEGNTTVGTFTVTVEFVAGPPTTIRQWGRDRYWTASAISQAHYPDPAAIDTVFVAVGTNFPDSLAGAATAGTMGAPVLLVLGDRIPGATASELTRLDPDRIVVLGGPMAISEEVEDLLGAYADEVIRLGGSNRYGTAVLISRFGFPAGADEVFIAVGTDYPDAIIGGAAAANLGGPVLLSPTGHLPTGVRNEILRLDPDKITVVGGVDAISADVLFSLNELAPTTRLTGVDRFETAVVVSQYAFPGTVDRVYVAVGTNFPDALVGAAVAGLFGSPILFVMPNNVPAVVAAEILRLDPTEIVILGGTAVVSTAAEAFLLGLIA